MHLATLLLPGAIAAYAIGAALTAIFVARRSDAAGTLASLAFVGGWAVHLAGIVAYGAYVGRFPLANMAEYLVMLAWAATTLHLLLWFRHRVHLAGLALPPIAALLVFAAAPLLHPEPASPGGQLLLFHTTLSTLAMAALLVAMVMSVIFLVEDKALKSRRRLMLLARFPSLEDCDQLGYHALWLGFVLLSAGIVSGVVANRALYERLWIPGAKQALPLVAWTLFAAVLVARLRSGLRGRKSAYLTITGVLLGLLTVIGMRV
jgi:ABC-type uncharacterized transport system permease subunit